MTWYKNPVVLALMLVVLVAGTFVFWPYIDTDTEPDSTLLPYVGGEYPGTETRSFTLSGSTSSGSNCAFDTQYPDQTEDYTLQNNLAVMSVEITNSYSVNPSWCGQSSDRKFSSLSGTTTVYCYDNFIEVELGTVNLRDGSGTFILEQDCKAIRVTSEARMSIRKHGQQTTRMSVTTTTKLIPEGAPYNQRTGTVGIQGVQRIDC